MSIRLDCSSFGGLREAGPIAFSDLLWVLHTQEQAKEYATGRVHIDAYDLALRAQTVLLYREAERLLTEKGLTPEHVIQQRVHLRDLADVGRWASMFRAEFPRWNPATVLLGEGDGLPWGVEIALELVVACEGGKLPNQFWVEGIGGATDPFPSAVEFAGLLFTSGINPIHPETGEIVTRYSQLEGWSPYADVPEFRASGAYGSRDERYAAQMLAIYSHLDKVLRAAGSNLSRLAKMNGYVRMHMKAFTAFEAVRRVVYANPGREVPPATTIQVADLGCSRDVDLVFDCVGIADPALEREVISISRDVSQPFGLYTPVVKVGNLAFTSGELAYAAEFGGVDGAWENDSGRALIPQTTSVVRRIVSMLGSAGVKPEDIVRLGVYPRDRASMDAWCRIARAEMPNADPALVTTTTLNAGPYDACIFELDAVGVVRS